MSIGWANRLLWVLPTLSWALPLVHHGSDDCPDLSSLRSEFVRTQLDLSLLGGVWYEIAFQDLAQAGESCQSYNNTVTSDDGIEESFMFKYGPVPGHLALHYHPTNVTGVFERSAVLAEPRFPSVIVDVTRLTTGAYDHLIEYLCFKKGPAKYIEIRLGARSPMVPTSTLEAMKKTLTSVGVDVSKIKTIDRSKCKTVH